MRVFAVYAQVYLYSNLLLNLTGHCIYGLVSTKKSEFCLEKQLVSCEVVEEVLLKVL